jgi:signal transduction histidine kinase/ligand-binding sensor domain-containing protein
MGGVEIEWDRIFVRTLGLLVSCALLCAPTAALDPTWQISQYAHTAWRIQDGALSGSPYAFAQTADGYLWIGTERGLVRFDGARFVPWTPPLGHHLPSTSVYSLLGTSDGSLWIGTWGGIARWKNAELTTYPEAQGFVGAIVQDPKGTVWFTRSRIRDDRGPLCSVASGRVQCFGTADGIPFPFAQSLMSDKLGNLWIGSNVGVIQWRPDSAKTYIPRALERNQGLTGVSAIAQGTGGSLWVGTPRGRSLGLQQLIQGAWKSYVAPGIDGTTLDVTAMLMDRDGGLWVGTSNQGIYRVQGSRADNFRMADGLSSDSIENFYEDREGTLWVATQRGIDRFHSTPVVTFSIREGLTAERVDSVLASRNDTVWIANLLALDFFRDGKLLALKGQKGFPEHYVTSLLEDHAGRLWAGMDAGLAIYEENHFRSVTRPDGSPLGMVVAMTEDVDHNIWAEVVAPFALFRIQGFKVQEEIDPPRIPRAKSLAADPSGGIWLGLSNGNLARYQQDRLQIAATNPGPDRGPIQNVMVDSDGSMWASSGEGLIHWKQGVARTLTSRNGLPCDSIFAMVRDDLGAVWLDAECGIIKIETSELTRWWEDPHAIVKVSTLDVFDGAQPALTTFRPLVSKSPDGRLWFAHASVLQMVDPNHLGVNNVPPPVRVEQIVVDHKAYLPAANLRLPALAHDIEIDYTALSFVVPEKVKFRYKLEGHDTDWQDPQTRRQAFYSDLAPGHYKFQVIASNNDGVWNQTGATQDFRILPAFYQTTWFRLLCLASVAGLLWLFYSLRVRQLATQMQLRLEERLEERERIARDLHDTLLQGLFSASMQLDVVYDRLPSESPAKPLLQRVLGLMKQVGEEGRDTVRSLRSPRRESYDLEQAFSEIQKEFPDQENVEFHVIAEGAPRLLNPGIWDEVYRLGREAVLNAFRHSRASKIQVEVRYAARSLRILVRDNGCGIDSQVLRTGREGHWGLPGMRERAEEIGARMAVMSRRGRGTDVKLSIPNHIAFESASGDGWPEWITQMFPKKKDGSKSSDQ